MCPLSLAPGATSLTDAIADLEVVRRPERATALLDDTRRMLLGALDHPDSAAGLARRLGLPRQRLNYHLRLLEKEGLVQPVGERRKGNCIERLLRATARRYVISPEAVGAIGATDTMPADRASSGYLVATAARAIDEVSRLESRADAAGKRVATFTVESEIRFASADQRARYLEELTTTMGRLAAKYHNAASRGGRTLRVVAFGHSALSPVTTEAT